MPHSSSASLPLTLSTALQTPLPRYFALSPSRSSQASWMPVLAPLGTAARPNEPSASSTSTSTVGLPRLSRICRAWMSTIVELMADIPIFLSVERRLFCGETAPDGRIGLPAPKRLIVRDWPELG